MGDMLIVQSKVKETAKKADVNVAGDFADALSAKVDSIIKDAINRAKANGRKTIRGYDL
jgi:histone H3/H4